jgi:hypothetical protein
MTATFDYFGESLEYAAEYPRFLFAEFCQVASEGEDATSTRSIGVALALAEACVAEKDRGRFRRLSRANNAGVENWIVIFQDWTAEEAERPTGPPTDSSDGPELTVVSSESQPDVSATSRRAPRPDMALAISRSA